MIPQSGEQGEKEEDLMTKLIDIEGIGEAYAGKLKDVGLATVQDLLERCSTPAGRQEIADSIGITSRRILEWVNHADLFRVKGIGSEYSDLLEEAGVDTVPELAQRNAENLYARLCEVNAEKQLVRHLPSLNQVSAWIEQARSLPRTIEY
jgi:predicted flap endonuclease-1-like 5' DNA nuclease